MDQKYEETLFQLISKHCHVENNFHRLVETTMPVATGTLIWIAKADSVFLWMTSNMDILKFETLI